MGCLVISATNELWVLSPDEKETLDVLSLDFVQVEETREIGKPRLIKVTHPIREFPDDELGRYLSVIRQGNKIWWPGTLDGDSCLYVINSEIVIDPLMNQITFTAEDVSVELSYLPPKEYPTHFMDNFTHEWSKSWQVASNRGSRSINKGRLLISPNKGETYTMYIPTYSGSPFMVTVVSNPTAFPTASEGGLWLKMTGSTGWGYLFRRGKDSAGGQKKWVKVNAGSGWTTIHTSDDNLYTSMILRATYDGAQVEFECSTDGGNSFTDIVSDNVAQRGITLDGVGLWNYNGYSCLYDDFHIYAPDGFQKVVTTGFLNDVCGGMFNVSEKNPSSPILPKTVHLGGYLSPMMILRRIESEAGIEFETQYEYNQTTGRIERTLYVTSLAGDTVDVVLDPLTDFSEFKITEDEGEYYSQAAPTFKEDFDASKLPRMLDALNKYKEMAVTSGGTIQRRVAEADEGKPVLLGETTAPYTKPEDSIIIQGNDTTADYRTIYKPDGAIARGKTLYVEVQDPNQYNIYWDLADKLAEHNTPTIQVEGKVKTLTLKELGVNLKVGDRVNVKLPWASETVELRVEKTVKSTKDRSGFTVELGNRVITAVNKWLRRFKPTPTTSKLR